jgi:hypothetical protein
MGCRSLICVYYRGRFVVAQYCQWDLWVATDNEGEGMGILRFLWEPGNIERLREGLQYIATPTGEGWEQLLNTISHDVESGETPRDPEVDSPYYEPREYAENKIISLWPSLSRDTGSNILKMIAQATAEIPVPIDLHLGFANDTHFCVWAYVLDLDQNTFEVFGGSEAKQEAATARFNDVGGDDDTVPALIKSFSFSQLPATKKEFMRALKAAMKEGDREDYRLFLKNITPDSDDELEIDSDPSFISKDLDDEPSNDEVEIDKEEVNKLLEEATGSLETTTIQTSDQQYVA